MEEKAFLNIKLDAKIPILNIQKLKFRATQIRKKINAIHSK